MQGVYLVAKIQIFLFGLNQVGKTTLVEYFREQKFIPQSPTIGVSITHIVFANLTLEFTDVGGQKRFRKDWENYLKRPHIMVYVIDASDRDEERISDGRRELHRLIANPKVTGIPLLILLNKHDLQMVMPRDIMEKRFGLNKIADRDIAIYEVSAKTGKNLDAALNAMTTMVLKDEGIEYFVNEKVKEQSRELLGRYRKFYKAGGEAFKMGNSEQALASLNLAKEIASNLFQLGVLTGGKEYKKLANLVAKVKRQLDENEQRAREISEESGESASQESYQSKSSARPVRDLAQQLKQGAPAISSPPVIRKDPDIEIIKQLPVHVFGPDADGMEMLKRYLVERKHAVGAAPLTISVPNIIMNHVGFKFCDLAPPDGARDTLKGTWRAPEFLIFVLDAVDPKSFPPARRELIQNLNMPEAHGKPALVLVNNFDLPDAQPVSFIDSISELKHDKTKKVGIFEVSLKYEYNMDEPINFLASTLMADKVVESFVSNKVNAMVDDFKQMYDAFLKEARQLEKEGKFQSAYNRIARAKLIQEELFKHTSKHNKIQKEIKKCDSLMSKLRLKSIKNKS
ncbi:GTP-binding protein [Candidatus Bathyarchaeota archaeon]|nr:GTP-binding protein [Candidatus Bathyarchaeota archaeon]